MQENKITTTDALLNIQRKMSDETFAKQFNFLFAKYIDIRNKDKNAFYHKLLQHLTTAGLSKDEATDFLKDIRVKNADLIQRIEETQQKIKESAEKFEKARFDLLTNPLSAKNYLVLFSEVIKEINLTLQNIENKHLLNVINKEHFRDKINEIQKLLEHSEQSITEKLKNEKDASIDDVMLLQETKVTFNKVSEKLNELTAELAINKTLTQNVNIDKDVEKERGQMGKEKEQVKEIPQAPAAEETEADYSYLEWGVVEEETFELSEEEKQQEQKYLAVINKALELNLIKDGDETKEMIEKGHYNAELLKQLIDEEKLLENNEINALYKNLTNNEAAAESPKKQQTQTLEDIAFNARDKFLDENKDLEKELINSLEAVYSDLFFKDNNIDEKTMNFLVLSEYLHAYNNFPINQVYEKFKDVFDKEEFKAIVIYNNALMNNDVDDLFDFVIEQDFEAANIKEYAVMLKHNFPKYKEMDEQIEKELEPDIKKEKELEVGTPTKNKKFSTIDIG